MINWVNVKESFVYIPWTTKDFKREVLPLPIILYPVLKYFYSLTFNSSNYYSFFHIIVKIVNFLDVDFRNFFMTIG